MSRDDLHHWLEKHIGGQNISPPQASLRELAAVSDDVIRRAFSRHKPLQPSQVAKEMWALAKHLRRAAKAADCLGDIAMDRIVMASEVNRDADGIETSLPSRICVA